MRRRVILDVDTGSDDAVAIIAALLSPELEVLGITTVNGNRCVEYTTENTLRIVELMGSKVPVYKGCGYPIRSTLAGYRPGVPRRENVKEHEIHGNFLEMCPPSTILPQEQDAVTWLVDTLMETENPITIVPVGPLTNIANAISIEPRIVKGIHEIIHMGGGYLYGNKTAAAEYNEWIDPEACQMVLNAGVPMTFVPLDATHAAYMTIEDAKQIQAIDTPVTDVVAELILQRIKGYTLFQDIGVEDAAPIHDALCIMALLDETVLQEVIPAHCQADLGGSVAYGETIFDIKNGRRLRREASNCSVALSADRDKYVNMMYETFCLSREMG